MNTAILLAIAAATSSIGLGIFSQYANATGNGNGATQFNGFQCGLGPAGSTTTSHAVITPSGQENEECHGDTGPVTNGGGASVFKGFPCTLHTDGTTTEMHATLTPSGQANLACHS